MSRAWFIICGVCGARCDGEEAEACPACGGPPIVRYATLPATLAHFSPGSLWRYRDWLPLHDGERAVTLGEGSTPLVKLDRWPATLGLRSVYAKLEYAGPTESFKDRGATVLISHAVASGARRVVEDSSGNAGAAIAAYAAQAGLDCRIFVPASTPPAKLAQIRAYGGDLVPIEGTREQVTAAARAVSNGDTYYAGHNSNPYFVEGTKTFAFELAEAFGAGGPDHIIIPVGGGSLYCGTAIAIRQLIAADLCSKMPRLHLVQSSGCRPLVAAFDRGEKHPLAIDRHPTIAGGILIENPPRGRLILKDLSASGGHAVAVGDTEILQAQDELARLEGIYMEPTSAAAFAGLARLVSMGLIPRDESVVIPVTGSGLKQ